MEKIGVIKFSKNWNHTLNNNVFATIRPMSNKYSNEKNCGVYLSDRFFCHAKVIDSKLKTINEIIDGGYCHLLTGMDGKEFYLMMENLYHKKEWWRELETTLNMVFFEKVIQLDIFENHISS